MALTFSLSGFQSPLTQSLKDRPTTSVIRIPSRQVKLSHDVLTTRGLSFFEAPVSRLTNWHAPATNSGVEASISGSKRDAPLQDVEIVVESRDDEKITVRVDLNGVETQKAFDSVLTNLARTAPPIPGFRKTKGGKTSNVPKSFLLQMLGNDRVTKFVIQEIVSTTVADYVKKENLKANNKCKTKETAEELEAAFIPGKEFGFTATVEIEKAA